MKIKIVLAEDQPKARAVTQLKLASFEEFDCIATFPDGQETLSFFQKKSEADVILMDIQMPNLNGIEATRQIKKIRPNVKVIMLTVFDHDKSVFEAILAGADGYLLKDVSPEKLREGILQIMEGGASMTPSIAAKALSFLRGATPDPETHDLEKLTARETEVLQHLATGATYAEIAETLFLSKGTIRKHVENTYRKLRVNNKIQAIEAGRNRKII